MGLPRRVAFTTDNTARPPGKGSSMGIGSTTATAPSAPSRKWWRRPSGLDWLAIALFVVGGLAVAFGWLPWSDARATGARILPLLVFLGAVIVLAELAARAEVFDVIAVRLTILARGR